MKKNHLITVSLALLALGSLTPLAHASSAAPAAQDERLERRIKEYNEELGEPFESLQRLRTAPRLARVIQAIPLYWHDRYFLPSDGEVRDDGGYTAYAKAQLALLAAVEMTPYASEQQQEELWKRTLAAQAELKTKYPLAAQKLTDLIALVDKTWRHEQARPQAEREKNAAEHLKEREELAKESVIYLCYHQYSPAMQELLLQYLILSLESEIRLYAQAAEIPIEQISKQSLVENLRILQSLDTSKLSEEERKGIQQVIERNLAVAADLEKATDEASINECFIKHREHFSDTIWTRGYVLFELLDHLDLRDYYVYVMTQERAKGPRGVNLPSIARTNRRVIDAIKKAMAEKAAR